MTNLNQTQANWDDFLEERLLYAMIAPIRELREHADKFSRTREQVRITLATTAFFDSTVGALTLLGAHPGVNCTAEAKFFVRLTGTTGARVVSVYSAAGATGLVASGTAADGAVVTLAEQNASSVSGTWPLPGAGVTNTTADELTVRAYPDWQAITRRIFPESGTFAEDDAHASKVLKGLYSSVGNSIRNAMLTYAANLSRVLLSDGADNPKALGNFFTVTSENSLLIETVKESNGAITRPRTGWLPVLSNAMKDEATAGAQSVLRTVPAGAAGVFDGGNTGLGAVAAHTPSEAAPAMKIDFRAVNGSDTGDLGVEQFSAQVTFTTPGDERAPVTVTGPTIGQSWKGPFGFGPITLTRTLTKTGDGSNLRFAVASAAVVTGETNSNTDDGTLHWQLVANAANWDISFYKSSTLAASELVAKATNVAASASFTAAQQNNSGLSVAWQLGGTPSAVSGTFLLNPFRADRGDSLPDRFSVTVTLAANPGLAQQIFSQEFNASLNSAVSGSETASDGFVKAGTFADFVVQDN